MASEVQKRKQTGFVQWLHDIDPVITQPNYAIEPCEAALRAVGPDTLRNLGEI